MSDIRVKVGQENTIKSRVGQQNTVKVVSSISGSAGGSAITAENVIGGIASVTSLSVSGVSTFAGNVYIDGDLYVTDDIFFDEFTARNINVTGIGSIITLNSTNSTLTNINSTGISTLGIVSASQFYVSGISTFVGVSTFKNDVYIDGDLYISDDLVFDEFTARNINVTGIGSIITLNSTNSTLTNINSTGISTLGIVSASQFYVSGISTFVGVSTFKNDVYIDGDLYISDDLVFDEFTARNANITGILTVGQSIYYPIGQPYGVAYFDLNDQLVSTGTTTSAISETNYILTTDNSGIPTWSGVIDGGTY